jgi:hypothetical protein
MVHWKGLALIAAVALTASTAGCASGPEGVSVVNTAQNPALVRNVDPPSGWEPFQNSVSVTNAVDVTLYTVPSNKRLVIEFVSGFCTTSQNIPVQTLRLSGSVDHFFTPMVFPGAAGTSFAVITQLARIYAYPLAAVKVAVFPTTNTGTTTCAISVSGHLTTP